MTTEKRAAVLATYEVCEPVTTPLPRVGDYWQHPRMKEVRGLCNSFAIEDRGGPDIVWVAVIRRWIIE